MDEVIYGFVRGLYGRILDCKLAMYINHFDKMQKNMIYDLDTMHNGVRNRSDVSSLSASKAAVIIALEIYVFR